MLRNPFFLEEHGDPSVITEEEWNAAMKTIEALPISELKLKAVHELYKVMKSMKKEEAR